MAQPATITHTGVVNGSPASTPGGPSPSLGEILNTSTTVTYQASKSGRPSIIGATDGAPFVLSFETMTKVRFFAMRVRGGTIKLKVTSVLGTDQVIGVSDLLLWSSQFPDDAWTAIKMVGTADVEYLMAGDLS